MPWPNRNFGLNRYLMENSLPCLIDNKLLQLCRIHPACCEELFLYYSAAPGALVDAASLRASFAALGLCCTRYEHTPTCVLVIFAALTPCARLRDFWAFDTVTLRHVFSYNMVRTFCHSSLWALDTVTLRYVLSCSLVRGFCHGRNACFQISPRECNFATLDPTVNKKCERTARASDQ